MKILGKSGKWEMLSLELSFDEKVGLAIKRSDRSLSERLSLAHSMHV